MLMQLGCKDEDGEEDGELQAGLDVDQPAAANLLTPTCHRIAGHYQYQYHIRIKCVCVCAGVYF